MADIQNDTPQVTVRLAKNPEEIEDAQRLRYQVFYEEFAAKPTEEIAAQKRDFDEFDDLAKHLVAVTNPEDEGEKIIGTYRLINRVEAEKYGRFYSSAEYDLSPLLRTDKTMLELGRSCVIEQYRTRPVLQTMWQGIANYVMDNNIDMMFGCASMHGTDAKALAEPLSYLYHNHLAPEDLRAKAVDERYDDMNIIPADQVNAKNAFNALPPLIKGYLRAGAYVGDGAVIDYEFNTTDVFIILPIEKLAERYKKHYERINGRTFNSEEN